MNDPRDIAQAIEQAVQAQALGPDSMIQIPLDERRWVRVLQGPHGVVVSAVQQTIGLDLAEMAARREALVRLAPHSRWAGTRVGSVDAQGFEVLSAWIDLSMTTSEVESLLDELFSRLAACGPDATDVLPPPGVTFA